MTRNLAKFLAHFLTGERKARFLSRHVRPKGGTVIGDRIGNEIVNVPQHCTVAVFGSGNRIVFSGHEHFEGLILMGDEDNPVRGCEVTVGEGTTSNGVRIYCFEDDCKVRIGRDCMFADEIAIYASDTHALLSTDGKLLNRGRFVEIGDHVWVGNRVSVCKNLRIPAGSVIGAASVVTHCEPGAGVYAGNPARLIRRNAEWSRNRPNFYIQKESCRE